MIFSLLLSELHCIKALFYDTLEYLKTPFCPVPSALEGLLIADLKAMSLEISSICGANQGLQSDSGFIDENRNDSGEDFSEPVELVNPYPLHFGNIQERHLWKKNPKFTF